MSTFAVRDQFHGKDKDVHMDSVNDDNWGEKGKAVFIKQGVDQEDV